VTSTRYRMEPKTILDKAVAAEGDRLVPSEQAVTITRSLRHGHVAAAHTIAIKLGQPRLPGPGPPSSYRDIG
jgi:hypothetical protein